MSTSYLYFKCEQCGIEKLFYHSDTTPELRIQEENLWKLQHDGHESKVGIKATLQNIFDPETETIIKRNQQTTPTPEASELTPHIAIRKRRLAWEWKLTAYPDITGRALTMRGAQHQAATAYIKHTGQDS